MKALKILLFPFWLALLLVAFLIQIAMWLIGITLTGLGILLALILDLMFVRVFFCIGCVCSILVLSAMRYADECTWLEWGGFSGAVIAVTLIVLYAPTAIETIGDVLREGSSSLTGLVLGIYF